MRDHAPFTSARDAHDAPGAAAAPQRERTCGHRAGATRSFSRLPFTPEDTGDKISRAPVSSGVLRATASSTVPTCTTKTKGVPCGTRTRPFLRHASYRGHCKSDTDVPPRKTGLGLRRRQWTPTLVFCSVCCHVWPACHRSCRVRVLGMSARTRMWVHARRGPRGVHPHAPLFQPTYTHIYMLLLLIHT